MGLKAFTLTLYLICLLPLAAYGGHRLWHLWQRRRPDPDPVPETPDVWPGVTVQLPLYNERYVARRLIEAVAALDYPRARLDIQVLDDSTDGTREVVDAAVAEARQRGVPIRVLRRDDRAGFKAGALEAGLAQARGSLVAVFDADFVPPADFLRRVVPWFAEGVGMVQARWGHLNLHESWLTRAQSALLDGHFVVEHGARYRAGRWFNFNGTAGVWRREAIVDAGGWEHDTLTEDLDLSYRAQMAGWRFVYLDDVVVPAELPATVAAFKSQQNRWARGGIQTARKLLGRIWASDAPWGVRLEASMHLLSNLAYPAVVLLALLLPLAVWARGGGEVGPVLLGIDAVLFLAATVSIALFYGAAVRHSGAPGLGRRLAGLPVVFALGLGMAISQSLAVLRGLGGPVGTFVRTPKRGAASGPGYAAQLSGVWWLEVVMLAWQLTGIAWALVEGWYASVPFMVLFAGGYGALVVQGLLDLAGRSGARADQDPGASAATRLRRAGTPGPDPR